MKFSFKRLITQIFFLLSANLGVIGIKTGFCFPFLYCHACPYASAGCPIGVIEHGLYRGNIVLQFLLFPILIIGLVGMVFGRAVCGWVCPIGLLQRITAKSARKFQKNSLVKRISQLGIIKYMRYTKYIILITLVFGTTYLIGFMFCDICPVGFLTGTLPILALNLGKFVPNPFFYTALIIFILFVVLILTVERGWCKYFCPVGAILALFNKISILHISVDKDKCIHCDACTEVCPMGIDVLNIERNPECILCGKCVDVCPVNAIKFERK